MGNSFFARIPTLSKLFHNHFVPRAVKIFSHFAPDRNSQTPTLKKFRADWVFFEHRASDRDLIDRIPKKSAKGTLAGTPLVLYIYI